jgi:hypothetical protein
VTRRPRCWSAPARSSATAASCPASPPSSAAAPMPKSITRTGPARRGRLPSSLASRPAPSERGGGGGFAAGETGADAPGGWG